MHDVLNIADERWPSNIPSHAPCESCWHASPCLAVRASVNEQSQPFNQLLCSSLGCGAVVPLLQSLEEKLHFLRSHGIDAFMAWEDSSYDENDQR